MNAHRPSRLTLLAGSLLLSACGPGFEPITLVEAFRVLAVVAEPPEAAPGETSRLTLHAFDPGGRPGTAEWALCTRRPDADNSGGVPEQCIAPDTADFLVPLGVGRTANVVTPPLQPWQLSRIDATFGTYWPVRFRAQPDEGPYVTPPLPPDDERIAGFYQLRVRVPLLPLPPNRNPDTVGVYLVRDSATNDLVELREGEPYPVRVGEELHFRAVYTDDSREPYCTLTTKQEGQTQSPACRQIEAGLLAAAGGAAVQGGPSFDPETLAVVDREELIRVSWHATLGRFESVSTAGAIATGPAVDGEKPDGKWFTDEYVPEPVPPEGVVVDVWAVGRDGRGGTDIAHRQLRLLPAL